MLGSMTPNNLRDIMTLAGQEFRNVPDLASFRSELREAIDQEHRKFCESAPWPWMIRKIPLTVYPDMVFPLASGGITKTIGWGDRTFSIPEGVLRAAMFPGDGQRDSYKDHQTNLARGAVLELEDRTEDDNGTVSGDGNWGAAPFTIEWVSPTSGVAPASATLTFTLDPRALIEALPDPELNAIIRFPRRLLPPDVGSIIAVRDEHGRMLRPMMDSEIIMSEADKNRIGTPCWALEDRGVDLPHAPMLWPQIGEGANPWPNAAPWSWQQETWPVRETLTAAAGDPGGSCLPSRVHRIFASWWYAGRFGPPSPVVEYTTPSGEPEIRISGFVLPPTDGANFEYGRRLSFWMAEGSTASIKTAEFGAYYFKGFVGDATATTFDIETSNGATDNQRMRLPRWDENYFGVQPKYLRIYPRPSEMKKFTVEYRRLPRSLIEDTDKPDIDGRYDVLAWLAAAHLIGQRGGDPSRALVMVADEMRKLLGNAAMNDKYKVRFGQVMGGLTAGRPLSYFLEADTANSKWTG